MDRESVPCFRSVRAIYDYTGANNDELCLKKGDLITVTQTPNGGWFEGTLRGITGWFPCNYVEPAFEEEKDENSLSLNDTSPFDGRSNHATYNSSDAGDDANSHANHYRSKVEQQVFNPVDNEENRKQVIKEIIDSEKTYIKELTQIIQNILAPLINSAITPYDETTVVVNAVADILNVHMIFLDSLRSLEARASRCIRIGGAFMEHAAAIKSVHTKYCALHPHFVSSIDQYKSDIISLYKSLNIDNGSVILTSSLSFSFRRLDRYPALLQQLQRYTDEGDPDRGDTQRAGFFYRDLVSCCLEIRRHKEMELEVMLGNIKNWPSTSVPPVDSFGPIVRMNLVSVTAPNQNNSKDRYLVLFEKSLLLLSISREMTSFNYEILWPLSDLILLPRNSPCNSFEFIINTAGSNTGALGGGGGGCNSTITTITTTSTSSSSSIGAACLSTGQQQMHTETCSPIVDSPMREENKLNDLSKWAIAFANIEQADDWFCTLNECKNKCDSFEESLKESNSTNDLMNNKVKFTSESSSICSSAGGGGGGSTCAIIGSGNGTTANTVDRWIAAADATPSSASTANPTSALTSTSNQVNQGGASGPITMTPIATATATTTAPCTSLFGYWANNSLLPHPPLKLPDVNLGKKSAKDPGGSVSVRPSSPADDMAILAVIESYCSGGGKKKPLVSTSSAKHETDNNATSSNCNVNDDLKNARVEDLIAEVTTLRGEVKQLRSDLDFVINQLKVRSILPLSSK